MSKTICPVCKGPATVVESDDNTIYCADPDCNFMGILPEDKKEN